MSDTSFEFARSTLSRMLSDPGFLDRPENCYGVRKLNKYGFVLECRSYGTSWSNVPQAEGEFAPGF